MSYSFPTTLVPTTNESAGTNSPAAARNDILTALQTLNAILQGYGVAGGFPAIDANGQTVFGASFLAGINAGTTFPRFTLSSTAYIEYNRTTNSLEYWLNGSKTASVPFSAPFDYNSLTNVPPPDNSVCDLIVSPSGSDPHMMTDLSGATSVYVHQFGGNRISLWDATANIWRIINFNITGISLAGKAAGTCHTLFGYLNNGALALELMQWADYQTYAPLAWSDGVWVKNGDKTRRFLGAVAIDTTAGTTAWVTNNGQAGGNPGAAGGKVAKLLVYSHYNKRPVRLVTCDTTSSWTYGTASWRKANAQAGHYHLVLNANPIGAALSPQSLFRNRYISELNFYGGSGYKGGICIGTEAPDGTSSGPVSWPYGGVSSAGAIYGSGQNPSETQTLTALNEYFCWSGLRRYFPMEYGWLTGYGSGNIVGSNSSGNLFVTELLA